MGSHSDGNVVLHSAEARWIRAALTGDSRERRRVAREELPGGPPFQVTPIACAVAARRLFGEQWDRRVITTFARRIVERTPAAAALVPREVEAALRGMTGETELLTAVPGEVLAELSLAVLLGLADELELDDQAVDVLLVEAERETAAVAAVHQEPPDAGEAAVPDGDRWQRTYRRILTGDDFVPRAHPVARLPRPFPAEQRRSTEPASKAGRYLRHLLRGERDTELWVSEVPQVDLLRMARLAFTVAVRSYYLHPDPDLAETMALASATKAHHWPEIDLMKAEYLTRTVFKEKLPLDGITNRDVYPSCVFMLNTIIDDWDGDDAALCSILANAEEGAALRGNAALPNPRYGCTPLSGGDPMAKQVVTILTDDLDGGDANRTIEFGLDGVNYTIDLSAKNAGKLRTALDPYLEVASRVGRAGTSGRIASRVVHPVRANRDQNQAIRQWAAKNGYEVSERGRIPASIVEAFHAKR